MFMPSHLARPLLFALLCGALLAQAQVQDLPGTADHPLISRLSGSHLIAFDEQEFERYPLMTGLWIPRVNQYTTREVEGRISRRVYIGPENVTLLTAYRNFEQAIRTSNLNVLFSCLSPKCDRYTRTSNGIVTLNPSRLNAHYHNIRNLTEFGYISAEGSWQGRKVWLAVGVGLRKGSSIRYPVNGKMQFGLPADRLVFSIDIIEQEAMATGLVTVDQLTSGIAASGKVVLDGLYFDTNKTELKPESEAALQPISAYLKQNPSLRFYVAGHTDVTGDYAANLKLASGRAQAVVQALVTRHGIPASQLTAVGVGPVAPAASNASESGRALNRRVELVQASVAP
ncbi:MAG TPA: OmpA family protein [Bryobacteraceae bacterium]|nr:OmpA family protein [Bryobacteraceae bacterium]